MRHPNRSRIVKAAAVTMALAALACEGEGGVKSDRPATDRVADPRAERVVTIEITEATGPYDVYVRAAKFGEALVTTPATRSRAASTSRPSTTRPG
ncbi:hypothetical protein GCM10027614_30550 [Micromonospora vulcania]